MGLFIGLVIVVILIVAVAVRDLSQKRHPILRNYSVIGHGRYLLEELGPKLRQYIVASNNEERPFTRDQRNWVCHTGKCLTGVATQNNWLMRGLDPTDKAARLANYITILRREILQLCHAGGTVHPAMVTADSCEILHDGFASRSVKECFRLQGITTMPSETDRQTITRLMEHHPLSQSTT